jgi:putative hemolysin
MKYRLPLLLVLLSVVLVAALGCSASAPAPTAAPAAAASTTTAVAITGSQTSATTAGGSQIANPASTYCTEKGGKLEIRKGPNGETGYCKFPDGSECEEWAYMRGECAPGGAKPTAAATKPSVATTPVPTDGLIKDFLASFPAKAFEGAQAFSLKVADGQQPLWVVYTYGLRNFDLKPPLSHTLAIYTNVNGAWKMIAPQVLDQPKTGQNDGLAPDFLSKEGGVKQVQIDNSKIWLEVNGGAGAHSGTFQLLSFDGKAFNFEVSAFGVSPAFGSVKDVNGDGTLEVVLDVSDKYVFCYACGVRQIMYEVYAFDKTSKKMVKQELKANSSEDVTKAVSLAKAGLWKDAMAKISAAMASSKGTVADAQITAWDSTLIKLHADEMAKSVKEDAYPLLANVFYGDYAAAVKLMAAESPDKLFSSKSALIVGTPAEQMVKQMSEAIIKATNAWVKEDPKLAAGYFLRGWAEYQADPKSAAAKADVAKAAELAPSETLFTKSKDFLK